MCRGTRVAGLNADEPGRVRRTGGENRAALVRVRKDSVAGGNLVVVLNA